MKNRIIVLLTAWLICCAVQPFSAAIAEETRMDAGIFTANGEKNKSEEKRQELYAFGKNLK